MSASSPTKSICLLLLTLTLLYAAQSHRTNAKVAHYFANKESAVELVLAKLNINPTKSLCLELGKEKCADKNQCCAVGQQTMREVQGEGHAQDRQKKLCQAAGNTFCGTTCCISGGCAVPEKKDNLKAESLSCADPQPSNQELCQGVGLLWCDGECCGFSFARHKCFRVNHYGVPYIRCPIEATATEDL